MSVSKRSKKSIKHGFDLNRKQPEENHVQTIFEKVLLDIRNIENCLTYFNERS